MAPARRPLARVCTVWVAAAMVSSGCALAHERSAAVPGLVDARADVLDAAPRDDAARDAGADVTSPPDTALPDSGLARAGFVAVGQEIGMGQTDPWINAYFGPITPADLLRGENVPECLITSEMGGCFFFSCVAPALDCDSAGTLTAAFSGGASLSAERMTTAYGTSSMTPIAAAMAAGTVTVSASGGEVPAFSVELDVPPVVIATLPDVVARSTDYVATWPPASADQIWITLGPTIPGETYGIECRVPAAAGTAVVPHELIALFPPGAQLGPSAAFTVNRRLVTAGDYLVEVQVYQIYQSSFALVTLGP